MCIRYNDRLECGCTEAGIIPCSVAADALPEIDGVRWDDDDDDVVLCEGVTDQDTARTRSFHPPCARHGAELALAQARAAALRPLGDMVRVRVTYGTSDAVFARMLLSEAVDLTRLGLLKTNLPPDFFTAELSTTTTTTITTTVTTVTPSSPITNSILAALIGGPVDDGYTNGPDDDDGDGANNADHADYVDALIHAGSNDSPDIDWVLYEPMGQYGLDFVPLRECGEWLDADRLRIGELRLADLACGRRLWDATELDEERATPLGHCTLREVSNMTWKQLVKLVQRDCNNNGRRHTAKQRLARLGVYRPTDLNVKHLVALALLEA
jgi:hypothetical protein